MHARADDIVALSRYLDGVRYGKQGRLLVFDADGRLDVDKSKLDCIGLPSVIAHALGLTEHDCLTYGSSPDHRHFVKELVTAGCKGLPVPKDLTQLELGCIMLMAEPNQPVHSAIYLGRNPKTGVPEMIHSWLPSQRERRLKKHRGLSTGRVCIVPFDRQQQGRFRQAFRFPEAA